MYSCTFRHLPGYVFNRINGCGEEKIYFFSQKICVCQKKAVTLHREIVRSSQMYDIHKDNSGNFL